MRQVSSEEVKVKRSASAAQMWLRRVFIVVVFFVLLLLQCFVCRSLHCFYGFKLIFGSRRGDEVPEASVMKRDSGI